jgi:hypothetical protein
VPLNERLTPDEAAAAQYTQRIGRKGDPVNRSKRSPAPLGQPRMSWQHAARWAAGVQTVLVLITVGIGLTSVGADNPLPYLAGFALQFPASLLFEPLVGVLHGYTSDTAAMGVAAAIVVQFLALMALFRRPRR